MSTLLTIAGWTSITIALCLGVILINAVKKAKLVDQRSPAESLADLLPYAIVAAPETVLLKGGQLLAGWELSFHDSGSATDGERNRVAAVINQALRDLGGGWTLNVSAMRQQAAKYPDGGTWPDPITAQIDNERKQLFERMDTMFEGVTVLTVTYTPPSALESKLVDLMHDDEGETSDTTDGAQRTAGDLKIFEGRVEVLISQLSSVMTLRRLGPQQQHSTTPPVTHHELLQWLHYCVSGHFHPIALPSVPVYIDQLIGGQEFTPGSPGKIGNKFFQVLSLEGFPMESWPGIFQDLAELPSEYRLSQRCICLDKQDADKSMERYRDGWAQRVIGFADQLKKTANPHIDRNANRLVQEAGAALEDMRSGNTAGVHYSVAIVIMDTDRARLEEAVDQASRVAMAKGMSTTRIENAGNVDALMGTMPGDTFHNVRRPFTYSLNFAHFMPTSTLWTGSTTSPCSYFAPSSEPLLHAVTSGSTPFRLNLHSKAFPDVGNTMIVGPIGAGKSSHLSLLAAQVQRYPKMRTFCFDIGESMYPLTTAIADATGDGSACHFTISRDDGELSFAPLLCLETAADQDWAVGWIDIIVKINLGHDPTIEQRNKITAAVRNLADNGGGTVTDFRALVQDKEIRDVLLDYTIEGQMGHLLDGDHDHLQMSRFTTFEIAPLFKMPERFSVPVFWYMLRQIERSLTGDPAFVFLDEVWRLLNHEVFSPVLEEWFRTFRKLRCTLVLATQSLADIADSDIFPILVTGCPTRIFLPNADADAEESRKVYKRFNLNDREIKTIAGAQPKRQYYLSTPDGKRLYELALGPTAMALCATSDKDDLVTIKKLRQELGAGWIAEWVKRKSAQQRSAA